MQQDVAQDCTECPTETCCVGSFKDVVRSRGGRFTPERLSLMRGICNTDDHWTPEELTEALRAQGIIVATTTIYRNLPLLEEAQIIRRVGGATHGDTTTRYEHIWGREHHDHLLCSRCGKKVEFHYPAIEVLQEAVAAQYGFALESHRMELIGLCPACRPDKYTEAPAVSAVASSNTALVPIEDVLGEEPEREEPTERSSS